MRDNGENREKSNNIRAERLRECRKRAHMTQAELAQAIFCTQQTIWNYENGKREICDDAANRLAAVLGVKPDYLLGKSDIAKSDLIYEILCRTAPDEAAKEMLSMIRYLTIRHDIYFLATRDKDAERKLFRASLSSFDSFHAETGIAIYKDSDSSYEVTCQYVFIDGFHMPYAAFSYFLSRACDLINFMFHRDYMIDCLNEYELSAKTSIDVVNRTVIAGQEPQALNAYDRLCGSEQNKDNEQDSGELCFYD